MLKPIKNKIIVKLQNTNKRESGIVLTSPLEKDSVKVEVFSVSDKLKQEGIINEKDLVIIPKYSGNKFEYENIEYMTVDIDSILAVIKEE